MLNQSNQGLFHDFMLGKFIFMLQMLRGVGSKKPLFIINQKITLITHVWCLELFFLFYNFNA